MRMRHWCAATVNVGTDGISSATCVSPRAAEWHDCGHNLAVNFVWQQWGHWCSPCPAAAAVLPAGVTINVTCPGAVPDTSDPNWAMFKKQSGWMFFLYRVMMAGRGWQHDAGCV